MQNPIPAACLRLITNVLATLAAVAVVAPASATAASSPYGRFTITYRDTSTYKWQVASAVRVWNQAGTPFRFVPAKPRQRADIAITKRQNVFYGGVPVSGLGGIGFVQLSSTKLKSPAAYSNVQVKVVAHELGHALGLEHTTNPCTLMFGGFGHTAPCAFADPKWDGKVRCGPIMADVRALARRWRFTPRVASDRGLCSAPTDPALATAGPYIAGTLSAAPVQDPYSGGGVTVTVTNTGNTELAYPYYGIVVTDAAGGVLAAQGEGENYHPARAGIKPGESITLPIPPCQGQLPLIMRVRLGDVLADALVSPELPIRLDGADGDPTAPAGECQAA